MSAIWRGFCVLAVSIMLLAGCGTGTAPPTPAGSSRRSKIHTVFTPESDCAQVDADTASEGREIGLDYRVVCLSGSRWDRDLLRACREEPRAVEDRYRLHDPSTGRSRFVTCEELHGPVPPGY